MNPYKTVYSSSYCAPVMYNHSNIEAEIRRMHDNESKILSSSFGNNHQPVKPLLSREKLQATQSRSPCRHLARNCPKEPSTPVEMFTPSPIENSLDDKEFDGANRDLRTAYNSSYRTPVHHDHTDGMSETRKRRSNESHILGASAGNYNQPSFTYKTEYIKSYSPPREKLQTTQRTQSRSPYRHLARNCPKETFTPVEIRKDFPASSSDSFHETPASVSSSTPLPHENDRGFYDLGYHGNVGFEASPNVHSELSNTTPNGKIRSTRRSDSAKVKNVSGFITEYTRSYSPPRDRIHANLLDTGSSSSQGDESSEIQSGNTKLNDTNYSLASRGSYTTNGHAPTHGLNGKQRASSAMRLKSPYYRTEYVRQYSPPRNRRRADNI